VWTVPQTTQKAIPCCGKLVRHCNQCKRRNRFSQPGVVNQPLIRINTQGFPVKGIGDRWIYHCNSTGGTQPIIFRSQDFAHFVCHQWSSQTWAVEQHLICFLPTTDAQTNTSTSPMLLPIFTTQQCHYLFWEKICGPVQRRVMTPRFKTNFSYSIDGGTLQYSGDFDNLSAFARQHCC